MPKTVMRKTPKGEYYWVVKNDRDEIIATSAFSYPSKKDAMELAKQNVRAPDELIDETDIGGN